MILAPSNDLAARCLALLGGTFDPIHVGHIAVAQAAQARLGLDAVYFIPSSGPPHKSKVGLTSFNHRYAMVALGCAQNPGFLPSLAEAEIPGDPGHVFFSIDTVHAFKERYPNDRLCFIVGADQFLELPTWKSYEALLDSCDFIVASRPGFKLETLRHVIPPGKLNPIAGKNPKRLDLRSSSIHLLDSVASEVSSTEIRERLEKKQKIDGFVPPLVEEYILGQGLYR